MPELPDLEIICEFLSPRIVGVPIAIVQVRRPLVVRNLLGGELADHLAEQQFAHVERRGKFLLFPLDSGASLAFHLMMAGRFYYGVPLARHRTRDVLVLGFADGCELRYHDSKDMGKVYLVSDLAQVPTLSTLGPEALEVGLTLDVFRQRLRGYHGEIKSVLVNQAFVAGIGNAYADEICWQAELYPFRRRASLNDNEVARLYWAMRTVLAKAIETLRVRIGQDIDVEVRDFLAVHGKAGQPCPRCGASISQVKRERRATCFCRTCQPGLLVGG